MIKSRRIVLSLVLSIFFFGGLFLSANKAESNIYSSISKNLTLLGNVYKEVSKRYVDEVDPEKFLKAGINGMLNTLDPYTTYIESDDKHQLEVITHGKYGGVGLLLTSRNDMVTVGDPPFPGTPSARAGIREGDIIIKIDGVLTKTLSFDETARRIRGPAGSEVSLTIHRDGESKDLEFTLVREQIKIDDVDYTGVISDHIGYIRLIRFSKNAGPTVAHAIDTLKSENIRGLILDLRSNPGGMLDAAVEVADLFLDKNLTIVSTRGRIKSAEHKFSSLRAPRYGSGPFVVLVDRISASASEIVAGAVQDHDRGVVVGDTTFGKGLVQSVVSLRPASALLKITTAKYYTPSGRCIQRHNYSQWGVVDTTTQNIAYQTSSGRTVYGGGGIIPDIIIPPKQYTDLFFDLRRKYHFFNFAVHYANTHKNVDSNFKVTDDIIQEFKNYLKEKLYEYQHPLEKDLLNLKKEALEKDYGNVLIQDIDRLQTTLNLAKDGMLFSSSENIRVMLNRELATKLFGKKRGVELSLKDDPVIGKALDLLNNQSLYSTILNSKQK